MAEYININIGAELHQKLRIKAATDGVNIKSVAIDAIKEYLAKKDKKKDIN